MWGNRNRKQAEKQKKKNSKHEESDLREKINVVGLENPAPNKGDSSWGREEKEEQHEFSPLLKGHLQFNRLCLLSITSTGMTAGICFII